MVGQGKQTSAERRRERAAAAREAAFAARRKQRLKAVGVVVAIALLAGAGTGAWFGAKALFGDDDDVVAETPPAEPTTSPAPAGKANCDYVTDTAPAAKDAGVPPALADATGTYYATLTINKSPVVMELDAAAAPCTVNSFVHLAKAGYYDGTICHRELNNDADEKLGTLQAHVIQCGDPTGTGSGGPGYTFPDENLDGATYEKGVVAMANGGADTNGSQFFMMFDESGFPPNYIPFAKIISGIDVLTEIAKAGTKGANNDEPKTKISVSKVEISTTRPASSKPKS